MAYIDTLRHSAKMYNQQHIFRFWDEFDDAERKRFEHDVSEIDFALLKKLLARWVYNEPEPEKFLHIDPVPTIPMVDPKDERARIALDAGEAALRAGRVGLFLVAGGQGTRLGYEGPKGTFPIGPITQKTLFEYHAEKIRKLQERYGCVLPWYIMVSEENHAPTEQFFKDNDYLGLNPEDIKFLEQDMMPCVDEAGKILLARKDKVAKNPNGHGGCIPAMEDSGVLSDAARRGVDLLFYFQVDNWAVNLADPYFLGYHLLNEGEMSSKVHLKQEPHE